MRLSSVVARLASIGRAWLKRLASPPDWTLPSPPPASPASTGRCSPRHTTKPGASLIGLVDFSSSPDPLAPGSLTSLERLLTTYSERSRLLPPWMQPDLRAETRRMLGLPDSQPPPPSSCPSTGSHPGSSTGYAAQRESATPCDDESMRPSGENSLTPGCFYLTSLVQAETPTSPTTSSYNSSTFDTPTTDPPSSPPTYGE